MVEGQKMIDFLFQDNTELQQQCGLSASDWKAKCKLAQPNHNCDGDRKVEIYLSSLRSNLRTHKPLFYEETDKVHYAAEHHGNLANHTDHNMQKTTMIDPVTWCQYQ